MKQFVSLFQSLDRTTKTNEKIHALANYFNLASDSDKLWTIALFTDRHPKRAVKSAQLREWASEAAGLPLWLFEDSWHTVGDLSETISSVLPDYSCETDYGLTYWIEYIQAMHSMSEEDRKAAILNAWKQFSKDERFVFNKLTSGSFRIGVSQKLLTKSLAKATGIDEQLLTHRLMGTWQPAGMSFAQLVIEGNITDDVSKPYPFYLAYALTEDPETLGSISEWQIEYKWDGIRCQLIKRNDTVYLWSRGEELITHQFPDVEYDMQHLPNGTVLDGELLAVDDGFPASFHVLQKRLNRKKPSAKQIAEIPACIYVYDILEWQATDLRNEPLHIRRQLLEQVISQHARQGLVLSPLIECTGWHHVAKIQHESRNKKAEGLMLKHKTSIYQSGRKRGEWWKWKVDPLTMDAVLIYAQSGSGRRANLYTDYTFAVWNNDAKLVPVAKAYSGLTDAEIVELDTWIKQHTLEKFGPVRSVPPLQVFEIAFEAINHSPRHKSGIAVRFPRIARWRKDKRPEDADHLDTILQLL